VTRLSLYESVAQQTASVVIRRYSTSFGLASKLLEPSVRRHVENIYALVRVADEIVDGVAVEAGLDTVAVARALNEFERDTHLAIANGFSANLVIQAFAITARETSFGEELTEPFFASMRMDLSETEHDQDSFDRYVYGSAEVVGLMCLRAFLKDIELTDAERSRFDRGACALGAAFQKVNFLRDLAADFDSLGRSYFPGISVESFTEADKLRLVDDIDLDLRTAAAVIPDLPAGSRRAVVLAHDLFADLGRRLRATPAAELRTTRVRVPNPVKLRIATAAALGRKPRT